MGGKAEQVSEPRIDPALVQSILSSRTFSRSRRMCRFLTLLVDRANLGNPEQLKETEIGVLVFDREVGYDPKVDSIVRTEATRLRRKLSEYFAGEGLSSPILLHLVPGRYELEVHPNAPPPPVVVAPHPQPRRLPYQAVIIAALAAMGVLVWRVETSRAPRMPITTPVTAYPGIETEPSFSPDGTRFAFTWDGENHDVAAIYVQAANAEAPLRLTHSAVPESQPAWSPDGGEIAFLRRVASNRFELRKVRAVAVAGENAHDTLVAELQARVDTMPGLSWSRDGAWLATAEPPTPDDRLRLILISPKTGEKRIYRQVENVSCMRPAFSPDGRSLAYVRGFDSAVSEVFVAGFPSGREQQITFDKTVVWSVAWTPDGHELVISSGREGKTALWRFPIGGAPVRLTDGIQPAYYPTVAADGRLMFSLVMEDTNVWRTRLAGGIPEGSGVPWLVSSGLDSSPQFSPDGQRVAFRSSRSGTNQVWTAASNGQNLRRLTDMGSSVTGSPRWSPDGKWIAFDSRASGDADVYIMAAAGGEARRLTPESSNESLPSWSHDGRFIYYNSDGLGKWSMWRRPWQGGEPQLIRERACAGWESPDAQYLYYVHSPNEPGLFRALLKGGPEEPVLPNLSPGMWGNWAFSRGGIFFIDWVNTADGREGWAMRLGPSREIRKLFRVAHPILWDGSMAVSPDEGWLAYAQVDRSGSDLVEMKGWR